MAHKTEASGEYPWPPGVASIIYDYYFDAPEILGAGNEMFALCVDGTLHVCPHDSSTFHYTDIESIASNDLDPGHVGTKFSACVVIKRSGEVFTRGDHRAGGVLDMHAQNAIQASRDRGAYPTSVYHTPGTFAVRFSNGDQVFWCNTERWQPNLGKLDLSKVDTLFTNNWWFAALMKDKTVQTWPAKELPVKLHTEVDHKELTGVARIYSTWGAFAALRGDGTVVTWGHTYSGGDSRGVNETLTKVKDIFNTDYAFAALKEDGTVVTWGHPYEGGDSSDVSKELEKVKGICAARSAFAAWRSDGAVVTWGCNAGGDVYSRVAKLPPVIDIKSTEVTFGARTLDNGFVMWQHPDTVVKSLVQDALGSRHVTQIYSNSVAFTAIADTTAFTPDSWGPSAALDVTDIGSQPLIRVVSQRENFLATIGTGDVVAWGQGGIRFVDRGYAHTINEHQASIREAFKNATGMG